MEIVYSKQAVKDLKGSEGHGMISNMLSLDDIETADDYKAYQESTKESVFTRHEDLLKELL